MASRGVMSDSFTLPLFFKSICMIKHAAPCGLSAIWQEQLLSALDMPYSDSPHKRSP